MKSENESTTNNLKIKNIPVVGYFWERSFLHYLWTGGLFTFLNIFLVWLCIDILKIPTVVASTAVIGGLFILRYLFYRWFKVM